MNGRGTEKQSGAGMTWRSRLLVGLTTLGFVLGLGVLAPAPAEAVTVRPGAKWGQIDVLMDSYETEQVRRSLWAATVVCWQSGVVGKLTVLGVCQTAVTVCAAQAYYASPRRNAGLTFTPWGQFWCWKY